MGSQEPVSTEHDKIQTSTLPSLWQLALLFAKIGTIGFGGGFAVIALMERECVARKKLLGADEFVHGVALGQVLGSVTVNTAFFVGYRIRGLAGGLVTMIAFLMPSVAMVIGLSWVYFQLRTIPRLANVLAAAGPIVIALIATAAFSLGRKTLRTPCAWLIASGAFVACLFRVSTLGVLAVSGVTGLLLRMSRKMASPEEGGCAVGQKNANQEGTSSPTSARSSVTQHARHACHDQRSHPTEPPTGQSLAIMPTIPTSPFASLAASAPLLACVFAFLKIGFVFFGGGYLLIPLLHEQFVGGYRWLSEREFVDGLAISQLTPGPIAVLATFVGYHVAGALGAIIATVALYTPATILMIVLSRSYDLVQRNRIVRDVLAGLTPAVVAFVAGSAIILVPSSGLSFTHPLSLAVGAAAFLMLVRGTPPALVVACGIGLGVFFPKLWQ